MGVSAPSLHIESTDSMISGKQSVMGLNPTRSSQSFFENDRFSQVVLCCFVFLLCCCVALSCVHLNTCSYSCVLHFLSCRG